MGKYNINLSGDVISIELISEDFDYKIAKEIRIEIERTISESEEIVKKVEIYMGKTKFIDTSGVSLLVFIYRDICNHVELVGCTIETVNVLNELKLNGLFKVK